VCVCMYTCVCKCWSVQTGIYVRSWVEYALVWARVGVGLVVRPCVVIMVLVRDWACACNG